MFGMDLLDLLKQILELSWKDTSLVICGVFSVPLALDGMGLS